MNGSARHSHGHVALQANSKSMAVCEYYLCVRVIT